jgi:opacity protein-like surface antigen
MKISQLLIASALLGPVFIAPNAHADEWYGKLSIGQSSADVGGLTLNDGLAYGAAIGTGVGPVRVEAGVARLSGDFAGAINADALDYHATAYLDLPVGDNASVFGGVGIDYVDGEASFGFGSVNASGEGYHWAVGGAYRLSERMIGEVQFRRIEADMDSDFGGFDVAADELTVGVRFRL